MSKKFTYKDILYKGKRLLAVCLLVIFCTGLLVSGKLKKDDEIPVHDGDVLVDSLAVSQEAGENLQSGTFEERRAKLDLERNKLLAALDSTINNSESKDEKNNASMKKQQIVDCMEKEIAIEALIEGKGLPPSFVVITDSSVCITVDMENLDSNTVAKICDIAMRETGRGADKIVVQSVH